LIKGIDDLSLNNHDPIYYIGDHETDVVFSNNAAEVLQSRKSTTKIISIGAFYGNDQSVTDWTIQPDFVASTPNDLIQIING
jgi:phosphoglycolate phosphatase-like HAD superfamily hydrolase